MRRKLTFPALLMLLILLAGCADAGDTIRFRKVDSGLPNSRSASYELNLGNRVGGASAVAELWLDGECVSSTPVTLCADTPVLSMTFRVGGFGSGQDARGLDVQLETGEVSGSVLTHFELPEKVLGYSFTAYEDGETLEIRPDEERILVAMAFDTGSGVRTVDCETLAEDGTRLADYSCILVIRADFMSERIEPQAEAPAAGA